MKKKERKGRTAPLLFMVHTMGRSARGQPKGSICGEEDNDSEHFYADNAIVGNAISKPITNSMMPKIQQVMKLLYEIITISWFLVMLPTARKMNEITIHTIIAISAHNSTWKVVFSTLTPFYPTVQTDIL